MKTSTQFNGKGHRVATYIRHEKRRRPFAVWKREVWGVIRCRDVNGRELPLVRASEVIKRLADNSFNAGELTRRGRDAAHAWADRIFWRIRPGVVE